MAALGGSGVGNGGCASRGGHGTEPGISTDEIYVSVSFRNYGLGFSSWILCSSRTWLEPLCDLGKATVWRPESFALNERGVCASVSAFAAPVVLCGGCCFPSVTLMKRPCKICFLFSLFLE